MLPLLKGGWMGIRYIPFHPGHAKTVGINAEILFEYLNYCKRYAGKDGYLEHSHTSIEQNTCLGRSKQRIALLKLEEHNWISSRAKGKGFTREYRVKKRH